jgi:hypothetical protein
VRTKLDSVLNRSPLHLHSNLIISIQISSSAFKSHHLHSNLVISIQISSSAFKSHHLHSNLIICIQISSSAFKSHHLHSNLIICIQISSSAFKSHHLHGCITCFMLRFIPEESESLCSLTSVTTPSNYCHIVFLGCWNWQK